MLNSWYQMSFSIVQLVLLQLKSTRIFCRKIGASVSGGVELISFSIYLFRNCNNSNTIAVLENNENFHFERKLSMEIQKNKSNLLLIIIKINCPFFSCAA